MIPVRADEAALAAERREYLNRDYLNVDLSPWTLDRWVQRHAILKAVQSALPSFSGTLLDVGCGYMPYRDMLVKPTGACDKYVGLDLHGNIYQKPDIAWDGERIPLLDSSVDCAMATEVFEHCPDVELVLRETLRVLKPKAPLFFTVPFLWPLHCVPHDEYRYTPFSLERHVRTAGFTAVQMRPTGGWNASLAQMIGLWVSRGPLTGFQRRVLSRLAVPVVQFLSRTDTVDTTFGESCMVTGLAGIAIK
ncbi:MAG TPA: class I SAM-dependent methyltransferase [Vicinamibacterales bacterium]|nr:class I SAM-dependent methyltransferase [Vicinamibacterales bacterium]